MNELEKSIYTTLAFYDLFDYPLTAEEIFKYLQTVNSSQLTVNSDDVNCQLSTVNCRLGDIVRALSESEWLSERIEQQDGFYFLKGHSKNVDTRRRRHTPAQKKWDKAMRLIRQLRYVPFVRLVGLCNVNPINAVNKESDIDLFIIVKDGRMWTARLLITFLLGIQGQWRHGKRVANKLCLSFFVTDEYLNLKHLQKPPYDPYLINWIALMAPLYARDESIYEEFKRSNNWIGEWMVNFQGFTPAWRRRVEDSRFTRAAHRSSEFILRGRFGNAIERIVKKPQLKYMDRLHKTVSKEPTTDVVICDKVLKFHENDARELVRDKLLTLIQ